MDDYRVMIQDFDSVSRDPDTLLGPGDVSYRVVKDLSVLTGDPAIDCDIFRNSTIYYSNGRVDRCDVNLNRVMVARATS